MHKLTVKSPEEQALLDGLNSRTDAEAARIKRYLEVAGFVDIETSSHQSSDHTRIWAEARKSDAADSFADVPSNHRLERQPLPVSPVRQHTEYIFRNPLDDVDYNWFEREYEYPHLKKTVAAYQELIEKQSTELERQAAELQRQAAELQRQATPVTHPEANAQAHNADCNQLESLLERLRGHITHVETERDLYKERWNKLTKVPPVRWLLALRKRVRGAQSG